MKTMWFMRGGLVLAFTLASCAPSTTDTGADGANKAPIVTPRPTDIPLPTSTKSTISTPLPTQTDTQPTAPPSSTPPTAPEQTSAPANPSPGPPTAAPAATGGPTRFVIDPAQSTVSYGVGETFLGQGNRYAYAVAATSVVSGEIMVDFENPAASTIGEITVDISAFQSDKARRDKAIRDRWLQSSIFPLAVFSPTELRGLPQSYVPGDVIAFEVAGDLLVRDVVHATVFTVSASVDAGKRLSGQAVARAQMTDFGFDPPAVAGMIEAENDVDITFEFVALPAASTPAPTPSMPSTPTAAPTDTATPLPPMPRGEMDSAIEVTVYDPERVWPGTTLLSDHHDRNNPRFIEVNMLGEVIWQYVLPEDFKQYTNPGPDVEMLSNGNILFVLPKKGIVEINRSGDVVWSHMDARISHDADRLPNGNTLYVYGDRDGTEDAHAKEVTTGGELVWAWYAKEEFNKEPYLSMSYQGWTHNNAVERLENGNTLVSPRNFGMLVEVDPNGSTVRTIGEGLLKGAHEPEALPNGNILVANHGKINQAIEFDTGTNKIVWQFVPPYKKLQSVFTNDAGIQSAFQQLKEDHPGGSFFPVTPMRDADRLPNGNVLVTGYAIMFEVTRDGDIVWQLQLTDMLTAIDEYYSGGFYKAQRVSLTTP